jgi:hypothetical protein
MLTLYAHVTMVHGMGLEPSRQVFDLAPAHVDLSGELE